MVAELNLTPTEKRMMDVLVDGMPHPKSALQACVNDELCHEDVVHIHISNLRRKLFEVGMSVVHVRGEWMLMQRIQHSE